MTRQGVGLVMGVEVHLVGQNDDLHWECEDKSVLAAVQQCVPTGEVGHHEGNRASALLDKLHEVFGCQIRKTITRPDDPGE